MPRHDTLGTLRWNCGGMRIQLCTVSNTFKWIHQEVEGNKWVKYSSEATAVCCLTPLLGAVIYYTVTVHLNTVVQPEVVEHYHCRCDPLTMKLDQRLSGQCALTEH